MPRDEKIKGYMKLSKSELAEMLANCTETLDRYIRRIYELESAE